MLCQSSVVPSFWAPLSFFLFSLPIYVVKAFVVVVIKSANAYLEEIHKEKKERKETQANLIQTLERFTQALYGHALPDSETISKQT